MIRKISISNAIRWSPLIWLAGLTPIAYHGLALANLVRDRRGISFGVPELSVALLAGWYMLALAAALFGGGDPMRVAGGLYNLSFWLMALMVLATREKLDVESIARSSRLVLAFLLSAGATACVVFGLGGLVEFPSILGLVVNPDSLPTNLGDNMALNIFTRDWSTFGTGSRLSIMSPYPTACGILAFVLSVLSFPTRPSTRSFWIFGVALAFAMILAGLLSASRAAAASFSTYLSVLTLAFLLRKVGGFPLRVAIVCFLGAMAFGALASTDIVESFWRAVSESRSDSSEARFSLYRESVNYVMTNHPLLGYGIKEREGLAEIPLGSHSTFVGMLYKAGIVGFAFWMAFVIAVAWAALVAAFSSRSSAYARSLGAGCVGMLPALLFEDIDALPLVSFLYFVIVGLTFREAKRVDGRRRRGPSASARS